MAAELAIADKVPIPIYPVSRMPADTKAPVVRFGGENIAQSSRRSNGMTSHTELHDWFVVEG